MAGNQTRQRVVLGVLLVALAAIAWWNVLRPAPASQASTAAPRGSRPAAASPRTPPGTASTQAVEDVALGALDQPRPEPGEGERNLFRFGQRQARPAPPSGEPAGHERPPVLPGVVPSESMAGPNGPPPIALRFVGLVERTRAKRKIAILTDGRNTFYGAEGDIIEGRYRIVQIGTESVELAYLDGSGRQRLRLAGS